MHLAHLARSITEMKEKKERNFLLSERQLLLLLLE
jgi:hypothetical protein